MLRLSGQLIGSGSVLVRPAHPLIGLYNAEDEDEDEEGSKEDL